MIDISFEIGGRKVNPNQIGNALQETALLQIADSVKKSLSSVRCSEHGQRPTVKVKGRNLDNLSFEVKGCCQSLIDRAISKLK